MGFRFDRISAVLLLGISCPPAFADVACDKSYAFRVDVVEQIGRTLCASSSSVFIDAVNNFQLSNATYTQTSPASINARFNDVNLSLAYAQSSTTLAYNFAELGESGSFTGTTRKESQKMFEDFVKSNNIIGRIMKYQAQHSASSPLTGAGGLIPMTIAGDFNASFSNSPTAVAGPSGGTSDNLFGIQIAYGSYDLDKGGDRITTTSIPLSYTIRNDIDPRRQLSFNLPLTFVEVGSAKTAQAGLGVTYRFPLSDYWTITPGAGYTVIASADRATVASLYSASLASTYVIPLSGFDLSIGNMLGYYATGKLSSGNYAFDPGLKYLATRNGVMLSQPVNLMGKKLTAEYSLIDTRYLGSEKPFVDNFQELSVTLGTNKSALDARSFIRGGFTYTQGPEIRGFRANIGYWF